MSITRDSKPHTIVITRVDEDNMEVDFEVEHNDLCVKETYVDEFDGNPVEYWTCSIQYDIDYGGLYSLATMLDLENEYKIKPGRYTVIGVYAYDAYNREGDFWLEKEKSNAVGRS